ncbi:MAG: hypothetical protein JRE36_16110 [Deltaproteobacteria bacterium]|nr:hypothetical protein [Deltaproteobacteria bacterium]
MPQTISPSFQAKHITRSYEQTISADPSKVFDLLCPVKEAQWLEGWDYTLLHSESGLAEEGCVFLSRQEGEKDTIWMITKRDVHSREIARLTIAVDEKAANISKVKITYVITALCEKGNIFLEAFTEEKFTEVMKFWEKSMNYYLKTGKKLKQN